MKIDLNALSPWADVSRILSNMKTLTVTVDGKEVGDVGELTTDNGNVTLALGKAKKAKKAKK